MTLQKTTKIIGIDPGTQVTGFGIVQKKGTHLQHVDSGIIKLGSKLPLSEKLLCIHQEIKTLIELHKPSALAIEQVFYAKNVRSAMVLSHARGTILLTAALLNIPVFEYSALEIKSASTGYGRAGKDQVFEMVKRLLNLPSQTIETFDQSDALAIAICHLNTFDLEQRINANAVNPLLQGSHRT